MKLLLFWVSFSLLLSSFLPGNWAQSSPSLALAKEEDRANASLGESQQLEPLLGLPWIHMYAPVKSCHRELSEKYGEFSPPEHPDGFEGNIWCNWTIWAGARKHIIIYIKGFKSNENCVKNEDKIFFHGVSSLAENTVIHACWRKEMHVFATYARGVHVVCLMRRSTNPKKGGFMGRYYIFKHRETKPPDKDGLDSETPAPEPSQSAASISTSQKGPFVSVSGSDHSSLSPSRRIDKATDLPKSLQAKGHVSVAVLAGFVWQGTSTLPLTSGRLHSLHISEESDIGACCKQKPPEQSVEVQNPNAWGMGTEDMSVEHGEPTILSNVLSEVPYLDLSPIEPSSLVVGMEFPSIAPSTNLVAFLKSDLLMGSTATPPDYHSLDTHFLTVSHDPVDSLEASIRGSKEVIPMSCQASSLAQEIVSSRNAIDLETISLLTPEPYLTGTKMYMGYVPLSSETPEKGRLQGHPTSSMLLLSDVKSPRDWETGTAPISEHITKVLDVDPVLESSGEIADDLKVTLAAPVLRSMVESDLHLRPRSEQSSAELFLDLLSEMVGDSSMIELESSDLLNTAMKLETSHSPSETTLALLATAGPGLSPSLLLGTVEALLLSPMELEPFLSYSPTVPLLLTVPDQESPPLELNHALSSSRTLTYPFISVELDMILSTPAMPLEPTLSEQEPIVPSITSESLGAEELEPSISEMACAWSKSVTVVETALEPETSATVLEPVLYPSTTMKSLVASATTSAFSEVDEVVPSFGLRMAGAKPAVTPARSSCCQHAMDASDQEDAFLASVWSSSLPVPVMEAPYSSHHAAFFSMFLEHPFASTEVSTSIKQPLWGKRDGDGSAVSPGDRDAHFTILDWASKSELLPSLDRFTVSALPPLNESISEMLLTSVPARGEKEPSDSSTKCGFVSSTISAPSSLHTELQTQAMQPMTLVVKERKQMPQPVTSGRKPHHAGWNLAGNSLEFTVADLNAVGTLFKAQGTEKEPLDLQTPQIPSDFENKVASNIEHLDNHIELEFPWLLAYLPVKSCHIILKDEVGTFSPPILGSMQSNIWCNWTIWAGPRKHILIYIEGFEGNSVCEENQDKIVFQGVLSSVESKVVYACRNHGTLIFATQAVAVHVVFLSKVSSQNQDQKHFKGRFYIFNDYESSSLTGDDTEEPVLKSNSSVIFFPKSYVTHSKDVLDFVKISRKLNDETRLPMTSRESRNESGSVMSLKAFLRMPLSTSTYVSPLKATENVALSVLDMKMLQVAKPSFDDRTEIKPSPGNLKKALVLGSESLENEEKVLLFKPTIPSPHLSQKFRTMTKLVLVKDSRIVNESAKFKVGHITTHQRPAHMKDSGRAISGNNVLQSGTTFQQVSLEEQGIQIPPPEITPVEKQEQILRALASNDGFSRKTTKGVNFQHLEQKEALEGEQMDNQMDNQEYRPEHGNKDQDMAVDSRNKSRRPEFLTTEIPKNLAVKRKSHLTTLGSPNVLSAPPPRILSSDFMGTTSLNSQVVLPGNLKNIQMEATAASYPAGSRNMVYSERKGTTANPPYSSPDWVSGNKASLGAEHKNNSYGNISVFRSHENYTILKSQHNPGDVLFEVTFGIDHKGQIPHNGSEQEKALIESIKLQVQEKVKHFSNRVKEIGLKEIIRKEGSEMRRRNSPNLIFTFWLHLKPEEKNISHFIHSQLKGLNGESMGTGEIRLVSVGDVNECSSGIELCGDEAVCLNGYGTYLCQCKEEYEDRSLSKLGTFCVHSPQSRISSWFSYAEILVGTTVFFIFALVVVLSVLSSIVKKRCTKETGGLEGAVLSGTRARLKATAFQQDNIRNLLTLDPAKLKLRAKSPEWPLQQRTSPSETYRVSIEQSECL
ncbi:hypothetical protein lerEdw1_018612 [Lerista edwardsae]|nr:hypothetical protein lerEdw1_018612 [Lerista edwardsae]